MTDQVDSVSHVLDDDAKTLSKMQYQPYGETYVHKGDTDFAPKYNSQELNRESGFYFYNARYYDPGIARFTSADTVIDGEWDTQGWNRFSYVKGNPIGAMDPTGHCVSQGIRSFFAATCSNASVQADKATHQDVDNRINYQNNSSFLKTATVVNGLAKGTPTNAGIALAMKAAQKIPGVIKEGGEKLNEKLYGDNLKVTELKNFGIFLGSTMVGMGAMTVANPVKSNISAAKLPASKNASFTSTNGIGNLKYDPRVRARGVQDPKAHNFPYSFDKEILSSKAIPKENGYNIFQKSGTMNNKSGSFEMGVTKEGVIDHRFFRPDK